MSDENGLPPNDGASRPITLVCREHVPPETLSAWRDGLVAADRAAWLERHAPACPACSERLRDYDAARSALAGQVIPRPGSDLWPAVRAAYEQGAMGGGRRPRLLPASRAAWGGLGAAVAALLLVALFAGLLISRQSGHPTTASTPTAALAQTPLVTATSSGGLDATPAITTTPAGPGYWASLSACADAPAIYQTLYNSGVAGQKGSATSAITLQRSDDCGATWINLTTPALPGVNLATDVSGLSIFKNPLNPRIAYLTLQVYGTVAPSLPSLCGSLGGALGVGLIHGGVDAAPAAGSVCQVQEVTTDGGASWRTLHLPVPGLLGFPDRASSMSFTGNLKGHGSRVYGVVTDTTLGMSGTVPPGRLVASSDGVTWTSADSGLASKGLRVMQYAIPQSGSGLFVLANPISDQAMQGPTYAPALSAWTSPDGGVTWTEGAPIAGSGQLNGTSVTTIAAGSVNGRLVPYIIAIRQGNVQLQGSLDGGRTWSQDAALAYGDTGGDIPGLLGSLPDGSALVAQPVGPGPTLAWKPGSAQRAVAQNSNLFSPSAPVLQQRADGLYFWLTGYWGTDASISVRFARLQY